MNSPFTWLCYFRDDEVTNYWTWVMRIPTTFKSWTQDTSGAVAVIFGICVPVIFFCAGMAIDAARWVSAKRTTAAAVDAAVLAGGRALQLNPDAPDEAIAMAVKVYQSNIADRTPTLRDTIAFTVTDDNLSISATGSAKIKTTILGAVGIHEMNIGDASNAEFAKATRASGSGGSHVEISLMLDVTGSMCDNGIGPCTSGEKLTGLKTAAKDLIDIVVSRTPSPYSSRVALVPFATRVRVGPDGGGASMMKSLTDLDATWSGWYKYCTQSSGSGGSESGGNWQCLNYESRQVSWKVMPCVTDRHYDSGGFDATDTKPGSSRWLNAHDGTRMPKGPDSSSSSASSARGNSSSDPATHWNYNSNGSCGDVSPANEIMPLSADKDTLKSRVDGLEAYGSTAGALGTAWAWYLLSPEFTSTLPGTSAPRSYSDVTTTQANGAPVVRKVAVLMTDGGFNTFRSWKDANQQNVSDYALQICTSMKAKGIEVYTVGFALDQLPSGERSIAEATLKACGTGVRHFYDTLTVPQLQAAFRDIALQMTMVYLSK